MIDNGQSSVDRNERDAGTAPPNDLLEMAPCGFVTLSDNGTIVYVNRTLSDLLGYEPQQLQGQRIELLLSVAGRIFYHSHIFPLLKLNGRLDEIYLTLRPQEGADLPVMLNAVREMRQGSFFNDCVVVPMHQRSQYETELLQAKRAAEAATKAEAAASAALQRANRALQTRSAASQALVHATTEPELLAAVCQVIVEIGGYSGAAVSYDPLTADMPPAASAGAQHTPRDAGTATQLTLPLVTDHQRVGRLTISAVGMRAFEPTETQLLAELADDLAYGIMALRTRAAHAQAEAALAAHAAHLQVLADASHAFAQAGTDYDAVLERVAHTAAEKLDAGCVIRLRSDEDTALRQVAAYDADPLVRELLESAAELPLDRDDPGPVAQAFRDGRPRLLPSAQGSPTRVERSRWPLVEQLGLHSLLAVPLTVQGDVLGILLLARHGRTPLAFSAADVPLAADIADRAAVAIGNARLYRAAQVAIQTRDAVMASVSHDLRNPLGVIDGYAKMIRRRYTRSGELEPAMVLDSLGRIERTTRRMNHMISEIVDAARLDAGYTLALDRVALDLVELLGSLVAQYQTMTQRHVLRLDTPLRELYGTYDRGRLERVLSNLLANAIKFSLQGGEIVVQLRQERTADGDWATIAVRDQGMGIPEEDLPRIFERFHRAGNAGAVVGTGLGLSGARLIVEQHGGTISAVSKPGHGSTFTLRLPLGGVDPGAAPR